VLDVGCGKAVSSIFLAKEFGVQVFAKDLWIDPMENWQRIYDAGVSGLVYPIKAEAQATTYTNGFFDAAVCINTYQFYGVAETDLAEHFARLVQPGGQIGIVLPGLFEECSYPIPEYIKKLREPAIQFYHCSDWWRVIFQETGFFTDVFTDDMDGDGNRLMRNWERIMQQENLMRTEYGKHFTWIRIVANRKQDHK
jgi:ubiquinone/menaquinone biosynthesis C-methylase UbiE